MKTIFRLILWFASLLSVLGATPSFDSFSTNDFTVTKTTAPWVITSNRTGVTNIYEDATIIFTNTYTLYYSTTNLEDNSTTVITNSYLTITNTIININGNTNIGVPDLWKNQFGFLTPVDPIVPIQVTDLLVTQRSSVQQLIYSLNSGTNLVDVANVSELYLVTTETNAANVTLMLTDGYESVQHLDIFSFTNAGPFELGQFTLPANSALPGGGIVKLLKDTDWIGGNGRGISLRYIQPNWVELGRWDVNTGSTGLGAVINPTDGYIPYRSNSTTFADSPLYVQNPYTLIQNVSSNANPNYVLRSINTNNSSAFYSFDLSDSDGTQTAATINGTKGGDWDFGTPTLRDGVFSVQVLHDNQLANRLEISGYSGDVSFKDRTGVTNLITIGNGGEVVFGPGTTNVLYRSGSDLVYTNGAANTFNLRLKHATGGDSLFGATAGGPLITATSLNYPVTLKAGQAANGVAVGPASIYPTDETISLGSNSSSGAFTNQWFKGTHYQQGMNDGLGNYSRLAISHTGTNGNPIIDSQSAGTAGAARDLLISSNGTTVAKFAMNSGYGGLGSKVFTDNGTYQSVYTLHDPAQVFPPIGGITGFYYTNIYQTNLAAGVHDVWTVPASYVAFGCSGYFSNPTNQTSIGTYAFIKEGSNYRRLASGVGVNNATTNSPASWSNVGLAMVFQPGETISISNSITGLGINMTFKLYPNTEGIKSSHIFGLSTSPTLIHTVPANKVAVPIPTSGSVSFTQNGDVFIANDSGSNRIYKLYVVPSGSSADDSTLFATLPVLSTGGVTRLAFVPIMQAGTSLYIASDSATELQWCGFQWYEYTP